MKTINRKISLMLIAALNSGLAVKSYAESKGKQPNVLLIVSDDQGYGDFGFTGNPLIKTPALDKLKSESVFLNNFVVCPACSPTRSSLLTGRNHLSTGVWGVPPRANLRKDEALMPQFFKSAGYRTLLVGKRDCAQPVGTEPWEYGWDDVLTVTGYQHLNPKLGTENGLVAYEGWTCDIITDHAIKFIQSPNDKPWFVSVDYIIPHMPWICDKKYSDPYQLMGCSENLAACWGSVSQMDANIAKLLDALQETSQEENTIVVFLSDNGPSSPEVQKLQDRKSGQVPGVDWEKRNIAHFRGYKSLVYDNGIRVPLLIRWPKVIASGESSQFASVEDVLPTLLDMTGIDSGKLRHQPFAGVSIAPVLKDKDATIEHPNVFRIAISFDGSPKTEQGIIADPRKLRYSEHHLIIRGPRFKYHALPDATSALYDLHNDSGEKNNVINKYPDIAQQMADECRQKWEKIITSGRAFRMPVQQIGRKLADKSIEKNSRISLCYAQAIEGTVKLEGRQMKGFSQKGDKANYMVDVVTPGRYFVKLKADDGLDKCAKLAIEVDDVIIKAQEVTSKEISFEPIALTKGMKSLSIIAESASDLTEQVTLGYIDIVVVKDKY